MTSMSLGLNLSTFGAMEVKDVLLPEMLGYYQVSVKMLKALLLCVRFEVCQVLRYNTRLPSEHRLLWTVKSLMFRYGMQMSVPLCWLIGLEQIMCLWSQVSLRGLYRCALMVFWTKPELLYFSLPKLVFSFSFPLNILY